MFPSSCMPSLSILVSYNNNKPMNKILHLTHATACFPLFFHFVFVLHGIIDHMEQVCYIT